MSNFNDYNLDENLLKALADLGYQTPTPVQHLAIPMVLKGADLIASAQTGTGKTAAFMLPSLDKLLKSPKPKGHGPRILVLAPTRELAMQISSVTEKYTKHLPQLKTVCIYGGQPYPIQTRALNRPYSILVATPGRLMDHMEQGRIDLSSVEFFVLDEADRMLDMGFIDAVTTIAKAMPTTRQTLLFSATLDTKIQRLSKKLQNSPEEIHIETTLETNPNIEQRLYYVDGMGHKMRILDRLLENNQIKQAIIFIATRNAAETLADELQGKGYHTGALHGNMNQGQRTRTIEKFRRGNFDLLVATDVAARGIDILTLSHVINIDLPFQAEDYIHRIGRTGRAGGKGIAITFATYRESQAISKINQLLPAPMVPHTIEGLEPAAKGKDTTSQPNRNRRSPSRTGKNFGFSGKPRAFNSDKPKGFNGDKKKGFGFSDKPNKKKDFGFSGKPRAFNNDRPSRSKDFGFSGKPRAFNSDGPSRSKDSELSSNPREFNPDAPTNGKTFKFSGKARGFNTDSKRGRNFTAKFDKGKKKRANPNSKPASVP